jgi:hypothetical protein
MRNIFNHCQYYKTPNELQEVKYQKYFWRVRLTFDIVSDTGVFIKKASVLINLENFPLKQELENQIKEKCEHYVNSRRFSFLHPNAVAQNIKYKIFPLINND